MNAKKDEYMRGYGEGFKDGMAASEATKNDCRCGAFCIEDTASTGRVCKLEKYRAAKKATAVSSATPSTNSN